MKKILCTLSTMFVVLVGYSQCTPNAIYQDSISGTWPDTIQNLPPVNQGIAYNTVMDIKTPATLIEAANGDSSLTTIDTLNNSYYIGSWPVDSMILVQVNGLPNGLSFSCNSSSNCSYPGDVVGCADIFGTTNDPAGIYPLEILINLYTHGTITYTIFTIPVETDLYSATGSYESIDGYKIIVNGTSGIELIHESDFVLFQNYPNPFSENTTIQFNNSKSEKVEFSVTDMFGRILISDSFSANKGLNTIEIENPLPAGIYMYSISNDDSTLSKRMIVTKK